MKQTKQNSENQDNKSGLHKINIINEIEDIQINGKNDQKDKTQKDYQMNSIQTAFISGTGSPYQHSILNNFNLRNFKNKDQVISNLKLIKIVSNNNSQNQNSNPNINK